MEISKKAIAIVSYFNSSSYFTEQLRNEQSRTYGQYIALIQPGQTRWNSYYFCYNSVLKSKGALRVRYIYFEI